MDPHDNGILQLLKEKESQERDRRQAQARLLHQRFELAQSQAEQLSGYRRDYEIHWQQQFRSGASPQVLQCYRQFVQRLDAATAQQAHTVRHVAGLMEQADRELLQQEVRVAAIEKLLERRAAAAQTHLARAQQRLDDEWAQRQHLGAGMPLLGARPATI